MKETDRFKKIYLEEHGEHLSDEDAERKVRLVRNLYLAVYRSAHEIIKEVQDAFNSH